ncbi:hypothetical protein JNK62_03695 [bacterium]|nr:hypothetical protein [bacterium]
MADDGDNVGGGEPNVGEESGTNPTLPPPFKFMTPSIMHYYGDYVRQIFVVTGAAMLLMAPFLINRAPALLPFVIGGAIVLVILAALTNPKKVWVVMADALAAGVGIVVFESLALAAYASGNWLAFVALEVVTIAFLFALYYSLKTVRTMLLGQIGRGPTYGEFVDR